MLSSRHFAGPFNILGIMTQIFVEFEELTPKVCIINCVQNGTFAAFRSCEVTYKNGPKQGHPLAVLLFFLVEQSHGGGGVLG